MTCARSFSRIFGPPERTSSLVYNLCFAFLSLFSPFGKVYAPGQTVIGRYHPPPNNSYLLANKDCSNSFCLPSHLLCRPVKKNHKLIGHAVLTTALTIQFRHNKYTNIYDKQSLHTHPSSAVIAAAMSSTALTRKHRPRGERDWAYGWRCRAKVRS